MAASPTTYIGVESDVLGGHSLLSSLRALRVGLGVAPDAGAEASLADELKVHMVAAAWGAGERAAAARAAAARAND